MFLYGDNNTVTLEANGTLTVTGDVSNGIGVIGDTNEINVNGTINANGFQSAGVELVGNSNTLTIDGTINVAGDEASGVLIRQTGTTTSQGNVVVHRGTITTTDADAAAFHIQSGSATQLHLSGTVNTNNGTGNLINIGTNADAGAIHVLQGADLNGHITNNGASVWQITFGRANVNGQATFNADENFNINYAGNIGGTTLFDAEFAGGIADPTGTQLSGTTAFRSAKSMSKKLGVNLVAGP